MANETLAQLSNWLIYSAIAVYLLAFFAFCAEWVFGSRSRVAVQSAALIAEEQRRSEEKVLVGAGVGAADGASGGGAEPPRRTRATSLDELLEEEKTDDGDVTRGNQHADMFGRIAVSFTALAFLLHLGSVIFRGWSVHRAPWGNMYEFSVAVTMVVAASYLVLALRGRARWLGIFVMLAILTTLGVAVTKLYTASAQLVPALHSYWLIIHVSAAIVSFAALHLGFIAAILFLIKDAYEKRKPKRQEAGLKPGRGAGFLDRLPSAAALDKLAYRTNAIIFPLWTFAIICGAIWAENAWGHYWQWDPKETWAFITWVAYAAYLHARSTAGWKGRKAAYIGLVAFLCFVFNYYLVNIFFSSMHSYAGV